MKPRRFAFQSLKNRYAAYDASIAPPPPTRPERSPGKTSEVEVPPPPYTRPERFHGNPSDVKTPPPPPTQLPEPEELAARIEEARTSAQILMQLMESSPLDRDLMREFYARCCSAQRSMQGYIDCVNPAPDYDTLLILIETERQVGVAMNRYHPAGVPRPRRS
jgi:hypothetical protein